MCVRVTATVAAFVFVSLAGCSDDGGASDNLDIDETVDPDKFQLQSGKGAIQGLVIDDRFRPIPGALVLLQPVALTKSSNQNGEFQFLDLAPGQYTVRVQAEGHEATPQTVTVVEGLFEEVQAVARRIVNEGASIITEEYVAFSTCQASAPVITAYCDQVLLDLSGDSSRASFQVDYSQFGPNATAMVTEMLVNKEASANGAFKLVIRMTTNVDNYYVNDAITEGDYLKAWMRFNETSPFDLEDRNHPWLNDQAMLVQLWAQGLLKDETNEAIFDNTCAYADTYCTADSRGIGAQFGIEAKFVISLFIGEPEVDIETYCTIC